MFLAGLRACLKPNRWRVGGERSLLRAAELAEALAMAEHLPVATMQHDGVRWHAAKMLKTVPVYGTREAKSERIELSADLVLDDAVQALVSRSGQTVWRDLKVKREDFQRYAVWLRSVW
jgi:hypothetical protein